jgi:hypothetical protein
MTREQIVITHKLSDTLIGRAWATIDVHDVARQDAELARAAKLLSHS